MKGKNTVDIKSYIKNIELKSKQKVDSPTKNVTVKITSFVDKIEQQTNGGNEVIPNIENVEITSYVKPLSSASRTFYIQKEVINLESHISKINSRIRIYFDRAAISEGRLIGSHIESIQSAVSTEEYYKYIPVVISTVVINNPSNTYYKDNLTDIYSL